VCVPAAGFDRGDYEDTSKGLLVRRDHAHRRIPDRLDQGEPVDLLARAESVAGMVLFESCRSHRAYGLRHHDEVPGGRPTFHRGGEPGGGCQERHAPDLQDLGAHPPGNPRLSEVRGEDPRRRVRVRLAGVRPLQSLACGLLRAAAGRSAAVLRSPLAEADRRRAVQDGPRRAKGDGPGRTPSPAAGRRSSCCTSRRRTRACGCH
jgi:hypothetical protein